MIESVWPDTLPVSRLDLLLHRLQRFPGYCNLCGKFTIFTARERNFREHTPCYHCGGVNRYRQMAAVLLRLALGDDARRFSSIRHLPPDLAIWNAETSRALHGQLSAHLGGSYVASEFIDPSLASGTVVDGVLHVDMQQTHFEDESLDYVLSSDVIEHIPWYQDALVETYRILKFGGAHIFTAPFYHHRFSIERRTIVLKDGTLEDRRRHWYHGDPLRPEGVLCFNVFAPELLVELEKVGFEAELLRVNSPLIGAIGNNGFVIAARKVKNPKHQRDMIFPD